MLKSSNRGPLHQPNKQRHVQVDGFYYVPGGTASVAKYKIKTTEPRKRQFLS